ncbi:transposase [Aquimarina sp. 2201CG1-2-11]|uniref:transposase n=1 Tax=Aquimarina discodermiae TaxID=3231043 RepID=UPI003462FBD2
MVCPWKFTNYQEACLLYKKTEGCGPDKGYCASQKVNYYGYKLHAVCSVKGVFKSLDIGPAYVHDVNYLKDIQSQLKDCTLIGRWTPLKV